MKKVKRKLKKTYRFFRGLNASLADLYFAWEMYIREQVYHLRLNRKIIASFLILFLGVSGIFILRLIETNVYAQGEMALYNAPFIFPLQRLFVWVFRGGLLGVVLGVVRRKYLIFKKIFDMGIAIVGLIVLSPLFFIIALLIKIDSAGPVFFKQTRVGKDETIFNIWKFRTMRYNAELETGPVWAKEDDPRTTKIGCFLRKSHLDELPQLFNVLFGHMSLIGPRPERPELAEEINKHVPHFHRRLEIKPGITGLAQVRYAYGASIRDSAKKLKFDLLYMKRICWFLDMQILFWTVGRVLTGEGAR